MKRVILVVALIAMAFVANPVTIVLAVNATVQNFKMDGHSMDPALQDGEFLLVRKVGGGPNRADVIVFHAPANPQVTLIKRVIGLPGETVEIRDGHVYINDQLLIESYIKEAWYDNRPKITVPADEYYVLGDNRKNSADSRSAQLGLIHKELIIGKAMLSYWPSNKFGLAPNASPIGFGVVATAAGASLLIGIAIIGVTIAVARRRNRSAWWGTLGWWLGGAGLAIVYVWVKPRPRQMAPLPEALVSE